MAAREVTVLGTASAVPTRRRNHVGLFIRWDSYGILVDPGEGTQRQLIHPAAGSSTVDALLTAAGGIPPIHHHEVRENGPVMALGGVTLSAVELDIASRPTACDCRNRTDCACFRNEPLDWG